MKKYTSQENKDFVSKPLFDEEVILNKDTSWPKISIIVAVYNSKKTLQRCIDSVFSQTYPHKELIIIDGGSTDGTVDILRANNDKITYWKSEPDNGIYQAWNKALDHAKSDWICFLGADDYLWKPKVCFNAHRIHSPHQILQYFNELELVEFSGVDDAGVYKRNRQISDLENGNYACGFFWFKKQQTGASD